MNLKRPSRILFLSCLSLTMVIGFFCPLDMLMNNIEAVWFRLATILFPILIFCFILFGLLLLVGCFFAQKGQTTYSFILIGLAVMSYIQGNFLNKGLNVLNGTILASSTHSILLNSILWLGVISLFVCFSFFVKNSEKLGWILSLILTLTLFSTLFIESIGKPLNAKTDIITTDDISEVGKDENIIVLLIDMLDQEYMNYFLKTNPDFFIPYEGFTYYENYMGLFSSTRNSVGQMLSGVSFHNETNIKDYRKSSFSSEELYLKKLTDSGYECDFYTHISYLDYCNPALISNYQKNITLKPESNIKLVSAWYKATLFRYIPSVLRQRLALTASDYDILNRSYVSNKSNVYSETQKTQMDFYNILRQKALTVVDGKRYKFIHLWGMHVPFGLDENCNEKSDAIWSETLDGCLKIVSCYLDALKEANAYDNSTIILLSDHGAYNYAATNPFLMVKPAKATNTFTISNAPVWQTDYVPSLLKAANIPYESYGQAFDDISPTDKRERFFYMYFQENQPIYGLKSLEQIELVTNDKSSELSSFTATGTVYGLNGTRELAKYKPISNGSKIEFDELNNRELFDYGICNTADSGAFSWGYNSQLSCALQNYNNQDVQMTIEMQSVLNDQTIIIKSGGNILYDGPVQSSITIDIPNTYIKDNKLLLKIEYPNAERACFNIDPRNLFTISVLYHSIYFQY